MGIVADVERMQDVGVQRSGRIIEVKEDRKFSNIIRLATPQECAMLPEKRRLEMEIIMVKSYFLTTREFSYFCFVLKTCKDLAQRVHHLPISVLNAAFQFDRNKLTIFYASNSRVDFREFVRDLFALYKTRIWMEKV